MPKPKKKAIPRRIPIPITLEDRYIAQPDAIAQTVYPITRRIAVEQQQHELQKQYENQTREAQDRKRKAWKDRKDAENARVGNPIVNHHLMTDQQIDQAIAAEERLANGPRFEQGYERPNYNLDQLAGQYANLQSFYSALGSPNTMPMSEQQVRRNPGAAATQIEFGLNNPALTAIQMAAPTGPGAGSWNAAKSAFKAGMHSSKPLVTRVATSVGKGAQAGGRALVNNAPRVAANVGVQAFPLVAAAQTYSGPTVNQGGGFWDTYGWTIPTAGTLLGGYGIYRYIKGRKANPTQAENLYKYSPNKKLFTWERPTKWEESTRRSLTEKKVGDLSSEWNAAVGDITKEDAFKNKYKLSKAETTQNTVTWTPFTNDDVVQSLSQRNLTSWGGSANPGNLALLGPTNSQIRWARARNVGRAALGVGTPVGGYFLFRPSSQPTTALKPIVNPQEVLDSAKVTSLPSDTVVPTIRDSVPPVTATSREELNSLLKDMFQEE